MTTWRQRGFGALCGVIAAAAGVGAAEGVAALVGAPSPITAVGEQAIDRAPPFAKDFAVETFGTADKAVLVAGVVTVLTLAAAVAGAVGVTRPRVAVAMTMGFGLAGLAASLLGRSTVDSLIVRPLPGVVGTIVSAGGLVLLLRALRGRGGPTAQAEPAPDGFDRRRFLTLVAAVSAVGVAGGAVARSGGGGAAAASRTAVLVPAPSNAARPIPAGAVLDVEGISPFVTPNDVFYRVDTALTVPTVDAGTWSLRLHGMVDREIELSFEELLARPLVERDITLTCVSNEVGGPYVGNARWIGASLADLLEEAGVRDGADALLTTAVDGFTIGTPLDAVTDGRDALLAVAMNGEPLPFEHGFPVRIVVPGLYGYVSATKWLVDIEVTRFAEFDAYWTDRGYSEQAPIKTASRIDVPRPFSTVGGEVAVAGVAWAQTRGITAVDVRVDGGDWRTADLADEDTVDTWRQWVYRWDTTAVEAGPHRLEVRASDGTDGPQTGERVSPRPDGATGWHSVTVTVA